MSVKVNNNVNRKPNKKKSPASSRDDWIRDIPIDSRNIYRFGASNNSSVPLYCKAHTIKKAKRNNKKPEKSTKCLIRLQELQAEKVNWTRRKEEN